MKRLKVLWIVTAVLVGSALVIGIASASRGYNRVSESTKLVNAIRQIRLGSSTEADAADLLRPFSRFASESAGDAPGVSEVTYIFYNTELRRLKLAPYAHLQVVLVFENGVAVRRSMSLFSENGYAASVQQEVWRGVGDDGTVGNRDPDRPNRQVKGNKNEQGVYARLSVSDDSRLSPMQLNADWNINSGCLDKIGGCDDARQILPGLGANPLLNQR